MVLYAMGILIGNIGWKPEYMPLVQEITTSATIPLAIPMMLFACRFTFNEASLQLRVCISGFLSVFVAVVVGYLLFCKHISEGAEIGGIMSGMYTGGMLNAAALQAIFKVEEQAYAGAMQQQVIGKVKVVPGEVEYFYNNTEKSELPIIAEQYVYAHITKYPEGMEQAKRRTRERLLDMRERIVTGKAQFSTLARMYSVDGAAIRGGELEPTTLQGWVKPFADAVEELKPGQVSEVVETQFGLHIVQMIDKRGSLYHCRHIVLRPTFTTDEIIAPMLKLDSIANLIRKDSLTFEAAALAHSDDKYSKQNGGIVTNHDMLEHYSAFDAKLTATKFLKEDFGVGGGRSIDDYNAIRYMKKGDISSAFRTSDMNGNEMCKIVKLLDIIPAHNATLDEDYLRLEQIALEQKQEKVFQQWLDTKIEAMYIYIAPEYRQGEFVNKSWVKKNQK